MRSTRLVLCLLAASAVAVPGPSGAQVVLSGTEAVDFDRPEAWAMKYFASLSLMTGMGPTDPREPGSVDLGVELGSVPSLSLEERTVGFNGTKPEDINRTSIFGRLRASVGLPAGFVLEGSYLPPVEISGVEPELYALALARTLSRSGSWSADLRLTTLMGSYTGDFTCSADEIAAGPNSFGCERPSDDEIDMRSTGLELVIARSSGSGRLRPYLAVAAHRMDLDFQVRADYSGVVDRVELTTDGTTASASLGLAYRADGGLSWSGELFYSPLDVVRPPATQTTNDGLLNLRLFLSYRLR